MQLNSQQYCKSKLICFVSLAASWRKKFGWTIPRREELLCYKTIILITIQVLRGEHDIQHSCAPMPHNNGTIDYTSTHRWAQHSLASMLQYKTIILITIQVLTGGHDIQHRFASRLQNKSTWDYASTQRWAQYPAKLCFYATRH